MCCEQLWRFVCAGVGDVGDVSRQRNSDKELLRSRIAKADAEIARLDRKLSNRSFLERAPCEIVAQQESRKEETKKHLDVLRAAVDGLSVQGSAV